MLNYVLRSNYTREANMTTNMYDFISNEIQFVGRFSNYWWEQHRQNPSQFPMTLQAGEWGEQLETFRTMEKEKSHA